MCTALSFVFQQPWRYFTSYVLSLNEPYYLWTYTVQSTQEYPFIKELEFDRTIMFPIGVHIMSLLTYLCYCTHFCLTRFDQEHGGIRRAISSGLLSYFHRRDNVNAEKDLAIVTIFSPDENIETNTITVREATRQGEQRPGSGSPECAAGCLVGALNGLHSKGYTMHESQLDRSNRYEDIMSFSRRRHDTMDGSANNATEIFIPSECEINDRSSERHSDGYVKQFAMLL